MTAGRRNGPPSRSRFALRGLVLPIYVPTFLFALGEGMTLPVLPLYAQTLGASLAVVGAAVTVRGIGALASGIPAGIMVNRLGGRTTMLTSATLAGGSALALAFVANTGQFVALMLLFGAGWSMWLVSRLAYVSESVPIAYRGRALALVGGVNRVGVFAGPIAGGTIAEHFGLATAFLAQAGCAVLAGAVVLARRERAGSSLPHGERVHVRLARTLSTFRYELLTAGGVAVALVFVREARQLLLPLWGGHIGLGVGTIGLAMGLASAVDMTLFLPVGYVMDRWGRKWTIVPSLLLLGFSLGSLPFVRDLPSFLAVALLSGFGNGLGSGAVMTLGADLAPRVGSGEFLGVWRTLTDTGRVAGPTVIGGVAQGVTLGAAALLTGAFALAGALVMAFLVAETLDRRGVLPDVEAPSVTSSPGAPRARP